MDDQQIIIVDEKLFWKVWQNKYLLGQIFFQVENGELENYNDGDSIIIRRKFKHTVSFSMMVEFGLFKLLKLKIEADEYIDFSNSNGFLKFITSSKSRHSNEDLMEFIDCLTMVFQKSRQYITNEIFEDMFENVSKQLEDNENSDMLISLFIKYLRNGYYSIDFNKHTNIIKSLIDHSNINMVKKFYQCHEMLWEQTGYDYDCGSSEGNTGPGSVKCDRLEYICKSIGKRNDEMVDYFLNSFEKENEFSYQLYYSRECSMLNILKLKSTVNKWTILKSEYFDIKIQPNLHNRSELEQIITLGNESFSVDQFLIYIHVYFKYYNNQDTTTTTTTTTTIPDEIQNEINEIVGNDSYQIDEYQKEKELFKLFIKVTGFKKFYRYYLFKYDEPLNGINLSLVYQYAMETFSYNALKHVIDIIGESSNSFQRYIMHDRIGSKFHPTNLELEMWPQCNVDRITKFMELYSNQNIIKSNGLDCFYQFIKSTSNEKLNSIFSNQEYYQFIKKFIEKIPTVRNIDLHIIISSKDTIDWIAETPFLHQRYLSFLTCNDNTKRLEFTNYELANYAIYKLGHLSSSNSKYHSTLTVYSKVIEFNLLNILNVINHTVLDYSTEHKIISMIFKNQSIDNLKQILLPVSNNQDFNTFTNYSLNFIIDKCISIGLQDVIITNVLPKIPIERLNQFIIDAISNLNYKILKFYFNNIQQPTILNCKFDITNKFDLSNNGKEAYKILKLLILKDCKFYEMAIKIVYAKFIKLKKTTKLQLLSIHSLIKQNSNNNLGCELSNNNNEYNIYYIKIKNKKLEIFRQLLKCPIILINKSDKFSFNQLFGIGNGKSLNEIMKIMFYFHLQNSLIQKFDYNSLLSDLISTLNDELYLEVLQFTIKSNDQIKDFYFSSSGIEISKFKLSTISKSIDIISTNKPIFDEYCNTLLSDFITNYRFDAIEYLFDNYSIFEFNSTVKSLLVLDRYEIITKQLNDKYKLKK